MLTYLPYPNYMRSIACLDDTRLARQKVEAAAIIRNLLDGGEYKDHPAVLMWKGFEGSLFLYYNICLSEWQLRGKKNIKLKPINIIAPSKKPVWLGNMALHTSHRSNLIRKKPDFYSKYKWELGPDLPYSWPYDYIESITAV